MKPAPVLISSSVTSDSYRVYPERVEWHSSAFSTKLSLLLSFLISCYFSYGQTTTSATLSDSISRNHTNEMHTSGPEVKKNLTLKQKKQRQILVTGINVVVYGGSLFILDRAWYKGEAKTSFQVFNDSKEWLQVDKIGHAWTAYNTGLASTALWKWAGLSHKKAVWIGGLSGFAYLTGIEFLDAHSAKWGWSWGDIAANITGSGLFMSQELLWKEQRIQFKFSFHKKKYEEPILEQRADSLYGKTFYERMLKDYNAQTYWFSGNIKSFFPQSNWPAWLNTTATSPPAGPSPTRPTSSPRWPPPVGPTRSPTPV